ncbi:chromosomal replication initiator protein DnaA [Pyruvatibacter sp.]|uniref:chromosomal replication initiator protein DnaA n=1 Tax=Pyruvatibacter sp. TaxID=1981328 RepID=UPI0032EE54A9
MITRKTNPGMVAEETPHVAAPDLSSNEHSAVGGPPREQAAPHTPAASAVQRDMFMKNPETDAMHDDVADQWSAIQAKLCTNLGTARFKSWFGNVLLIGVGDGAVSYSVPTAFSRDYIRREFGDQLLALWRQQDASITKITLIAEGAASAADAARTLAARSLPGRAPVASPGPDNDAPRAATRNPFPVSAASHSSAGATMTAPFTATAGDDTPIGAPLLPHLTFDNFVVGKSNQLAYAAARRVAESDGAVPFNPLYLYGPVGLGKTHLMHAIGTEILRRDPGKKVVYLSAERFMYHFVNALRHKDTVAFKHAYRSVDVLMVDDVQFIGGKDSTQEEFFHTFNALVDHNRQIIISADRSPSHLENIEERIRSRLGQGLACDILPTDYELRLGILQAKAETMLPNHPGVQLSPDVIDYLAASISSSIRELEGALTTLIAHAELIGRPLTIEHAQDILRHLVRANEKRITIDDIQRKVTDYYNLRIVDMSSPRRSRSVARPRQVAMYLCKHLTTRSLPEIGRKFGGRDHTTVLHGINKIEELRAQDKSLDEDINVIRRTIEE